MSFAVFYCHLLCFVLPSDQIRFLRVRQATLAHQTFVYNAQNNNYSVTKCSKLWIYNTTLNFFSVYDKINI